MPEYRFILPVRAIGGYRLPEDGIDLNWLKLNVAAEPAYTAKLDGVEADNVELAYQKAQVAAEDLFGLLALLGDDAAFILDGREGVRARNVDLERDPVSENEPPPPFESLFGVLTEAGQVHFGPIIDPDGNKRRTGSILVHNVQGQVIPGRQRLTEVCSLFNRRDSLPERLRLALGIVHDAACARVFASGFAQCWTALEVLTDHLRPPTVLDAFYKRAKKDEATEQLPHKSKKDFLAAMKSFFDSSGLSDPEVDRVYNHAASTQSASQVDVIVDYVNELGITIDGEKLSVTRSEVAKWRSIRGGLLHAATAPDDNDIAAMRRCRSIVRSAILKELQDAVPG